MPHITNDGKTLNGNFKWLKTMETKREFFRRIWDHRDVYMTMMRDEPQTRKEQDPSAAEITTSGSRISGEYLIKRETASRRKQRPVHGKDQIVSLVCSELMVRKDPSLLNISDEIFDSTAVRRAAASSIGVQDSDLMMTPALPRARAEQYDTQPLPDYAG